MSAPSCVAYVGLRFAVSDDELKALEERQDSRQVDARNAGLKSYWGRFGLERPSYALLVGTPVGSLGPEGVGSASLAADALAALIATTRERLTTAGMDGDIGLHIEWQPD
jgi:hypothetical protein